MKFLFQHFNFERYINIILMSNVSFFCFSDDELKGKQILVKSKVIALLSFTQLENPINLNE